MRDTGNLILVLRGGCTGFLSTKMKSVCVTNVMMFHASCLPCLLSYLFCWLPLQEFYWWEVLISIRKLLLVAAVKFSDGQRMPCVMINLFVAVGAFGAQVYVLPFANGDANVVSDGACGPVALSTGAPSTHCGARC